MICNYNGILYCVYYFALFFANCSYNFVKVYKKDESMKDIGMTCRAYCRKPFMHGCVFCFDTHIPE